MFLDQKNFAFQAKHYVIKANVIEQSMTGHVDPAGSRSPPEQTTRLCREQLKQEAPLFGALFAVKLS